MQAMTKFERDAGMSGGKITRDATPSSKQAQLADQGLTRVTFAPAKLQYAIHDFPGAVEHPYLAKIAADALKVVCDDLAAQGFGVLIWDAYRTCQTQHHILDKYTAQLRLQYPSESKLEIHHRGLAFVSDPQGIFPHGTGGAVDVTLLREGIEQDLGTGFDDFSTRSAALYFEENPPVDDDGRQIAQLRRILRSAMLRAGFVGIDSEWWHFEIYTRRWESETGAKAVLTSVLDKPKKSLDDTDSSCWNPKWPSFHLGVAQVYTTARERRAALAGSKGNYYARKSTRSNASATAAVARSFQTEAAHLVQSGLAAFSCAVRALLPRNGVALVDSELYYESKAALLEYAAITGSKLVTANLGDPNNIDRALAGVPQIDLIIIDSPSNWFLTCKPVARLKNLAREYGAKLLIDVSVQPMQNEVIAMADLAVVSLSKWPAAGYTLGGAILGSVKELELVQHVAAIDGHVLSAEAAYTLMQQLPSMPERITNASSKARQIQQQLHGHPEVAAVRLAEDPYFGSECGGQLVIELVDASIGDAFEQIVGFNAYSSVLTLPRLACTFGAAVSTIEHFASNVRHREGIAIDRRATGEALIPDNYVRVSIGADPANELAAGLALVLRLARDRYAYEPHSPLHL